MKAYRATRQRFGSLQRPLRPRAVQLQCLEVHLVRIECISKGQAVLTEIFGKLLPRHILQDLGGVVYEAKRFETRQWVMEALIISLNQST